MQDEASQPLLGWQVSDAVRCDPAYRHRQTGGGKRGGGGRFERRGAERRRWTTTLSEDALAALRERAERQGIDRNEVVEQLLLGAGPAGPVGPVPLRKARAADPGPGVAVVSTRVSTGLASKVNEAAARAGMKPSTWLRCHLAAFLL